MIEKLKNIVFGIMFLITTLSVFGQVAPVQVIPQMIPPYSLKLSDYSTTFNEKVIATILLTDVVEQNMQVGIRLYIENGRDINIQSAPVVIGATPIYINGGIPLRLSNLDLQPYFQLQNLQGISPQQYNQPLPDGLYQFCFEIFEWTSGQALSKKSCATAYLVLNDPPILNLPNRGESVAEKDIQNIIFQWTPRHLNATNVQYEFTLVELWDTQMNPQAAFLASRPLYQTTTRANTLLYGPGETALLPDKVYGWRVKALVSDGISETAVFRNDGYSEIFHFTYTGNCDEPKYVLAESESSTSEKIMWQGMEHLKYLIQVRKKSTSAETNWYDINAYNEYATLHNLEPGTIYQFRVGGQCIINGGYTYSQIYEFTTAIPNQNSSNYNCGITPEIVINNKTPLEQLGINDVFVAGDFPVTVKASSGENGTFSGWGYIVVPYLQDTKIKVSFNNIKINNDYQLLEGMVETDYDSTWENVDDIQNEIDAIEDLIGGVLDIIEAAVNMVRNGDLTGQGLDDLISEIEDNLPADIINDLQKIQKQIVELEEAYENAETEEEKKKIQEQINTLNDQFADKMETVKNEIIDLIIKAIEKYYEQNKREESSLVSQYEAIYGSPTESENTSSSSEVSSSESNSSFQFEGEVLISELPDEFKEIFEMQEKYHLYFVSKAIAENKDDQETIRLFIEKAMESEVDLIKIMKESQDQEDTNENTLDILVQAIDKSLKTLIDKYKYNYLSE